MEDSGDGGEVGELFVTLVKMGLVTRESGTVGAHFAVTRGAVAEVGEEEALIDVMGVGYVVRCGHRTLQRLPALGEETLLHIENQWSESAGLRLYGFATREDRKAFVLLQAIQGVGPKAAMAVLDVLSPAELASAVARCLAAASRSPIRCA